MTQAGHGVPVPYLRAWRERRMWTINDLANASGVNWNSIARAEDGKTMHGKTVRKLAAALGIEPPQLRYDDPDKPREEQAV